MWKLKYCVCLFYLVCFCAVCMGACACICAPSISVDNKRVYNLGINLSIVTKTDPENL